MNRRDAITAVSALFAGAVVGSQAFLSGCTSESPTSGVFSQSDIDLLDDVADTIIPDTDDSPGARAAAVGVFMNTFVTDCYSPEEQQILKNGLATLSAAARERMGSAFGDLSPERKHEFLLTLEAELPSRRSDGDPHYYMMIKQLTLLGYFTSEIGATQALRYVAVPGKYEACIPYEEGQKAWA